MGLATDAYSKAKVWKCGLLTAVFARALLWHCFFLAIFQDYKSTTLIWNILLKAKKKRANSYIRVDWLWWRCFFSLFAIFTQKGSQNHEKRVARAGFCLSASKQVETGGGEIVEKSTRKKNIVLSESTPVFQNASLKSWWILSVLSYLHARGLLPSHPSLPQWSCQQAAAVISDVPSASLHSAMPACFSPALFYHY